MSAGTYNLMTQSQEITVAVLTVLGGSLSLVGSATIIYNIISKEKFKKDSYYRLLLGTCAFDVISSTGWIMHTFAAPRETSERYLAIGNVGSCSASAFLIQCGVSFMVYNAFLAIYFLVTVRNNLRQVHILRMEKTMHAIGIASGLGCAIIPLHLQLYNENTIGPGCWLNNYPSGCFSDPGVDCIRGSVSSVAVAYLAAFFPTVVSLIAVLVSYGMLYRTVRIKELTTYRVSGQFSQTSGNEPEKKHTKTVASQAFWYVMVFIISIAWSLATRMMSSLKVITRENESQWTLLIALTQFFQSSTGLGFLLVFVRPRYMRFRGEKFKMTRLGALIAALSLNKGEQSRRGSSTFPLKKSEPPLNPATCNAYLDDSESPCRAFADNRGSATGTTTGCTSAEQKLSAGLNPSGLPPPPEEARPSLSSQTEGMIA